MAKNFFDKVRPTFSEGGKLSWLHSSFDAFETFFFVPNRTTRKGGTHVKDCVDLKRLLIIVVIALMPALPNRPRLRRSPASETEPLPRNCWNICIKIFNVNVT